MNWYLTETRTETTQVKFQAIAYNCYSFYVIRLYIAENSKDSLKDCFENVNIR